MIDEDGSILEAKLFMRNYQTLDAWKVSMQLVENIFLLTKTFPKEELYGLTSQTKRAAVSIPSNIAEGMGRQYNKDTLQFLHISRESVYELETLLNIAVMTEIINEEAFLKVTLQIDDTIKILNGLIGYMEKSDLK